MARKRKKSNTTINENAKRSKTEASPVSSGKNILVSALKAMIDSMAEKYLYYVMAYVATVRKETERVSNVEPVQSTEGAASITTTTTTEVNSATATATTTTTTTGGTEKQHCSQRPHSKRSNTSTDSITRPPR